MKSIVWLSDTGTKLACNEKIKVMQQNLAELKQIAQDTYEDGILMGISQQQLKSVLAQIIEQLHNPYTDIK